MNPMSLLILLVVILAGGATALQAPTNARMSAAMGSPVNAAFVSFAIGTVALGLDRRQRVSRWLFSFLHSWDLPPLLRTGPWREGVLILLSLGGLALSATGIVIGWRRLRLWWRARAARQACGQG